MQSVELSNYADGPIHCPFCGQKVVAPTTGEDTWKPCVHTLFIGSDEGWVYQSKTFQTAVHSRKPKARESELEDCGGLTTRVGLPDGIRFVLSTPAPSGLSAYVGFAPVGAKATSKPRSTKKK